MDQFFVLALVLGLWSSGGYWWHKLEEEWRIEVDDTAIVVHPRSRSGSVQRFVWSRASKVIIAWQDGRRFLLFIPESGNGFEPGIGRDRWDRSRGYRVCELYKIRPAEAESLAALENHSDGRFRR